MKASLVALNLVDNNKKLLNPSNYPILLYWNESSGRNITEEIFYNDNSNNFITNTCCNIDLYTSSSINFFYFIDKDGDGDEDYTEVNIQIQDLFSLSALSKEQSIFFKNYLIETFSYLYFCSYKENPNWSIEPWKWEDDLIDIYIKIQEKYPKKILKATVINYVRSELSQKYGLNTNNIEWIISNLENILSEVN